MMLCRFVLKLMILLSFDETFSTTVIVVPDVHGDSEHLVQALKNVGIGDDLVVPNNTFLIQLGDLGDRGPYTRQCYTILRNVSIRNPHDTVVRLLGNHETYFVLSDRDQGNYVDPADFQQFCETHESEDRFWLPIMSNKNARSKFRDESVCRAERRAAFSVDGPLGKDIRATFKLVHIFRGDIFDDRRDADDLLPMDSPKTLFVHAGLEPYVLDYIDRTHPPGPGRDADLERRLNAAAREALRTLAGGRAVTEAQEALFESERSAVWTRRFAQSGGDDDCAPVLYPVLRRLNVARMVDTPRVHRPHGPAFTGAASTAFGSSERA
jgi:hypothetical protein